MKYTENILHYFKNPTWAKVNTFYFTDDHLEENGSDQLAFTNKADAENHTLNLKSKKVTEVSRADVEEELERLKTEGGDTRTPLEVATQTLADANLELEAANKAKADLPADAKGPDKAKATQRANKAAKAVEEAQTALDVLASAGK